MGNATTKHYTDVVPRRKSHAERRKKEGRILGNEAISKELPPALRTERILAARLHARIFLGASFAGKTMPFKIHAVFIDLF